MCVLACAVDTVLSVEGDNNHTHRIVRAVKNRFGSTSEVGVFDMSDAGLLEVADPAALFLSTRPGVLLSPHAALSPPAACLSSLVTRHSPHTMVGHHGTLFQTMRSRLRRLGVQSLRL